MRDHARCTCQDAADALQIIELGPWILDTIDLVSDQFPTKNAMRQPVARVASDDVYMLVALVEAYEGYTIYRLENLTRPFVINLITVSKIVNSP